MRACSTASISTRSRSETIDGASLLDCSVHVEPIRPNLVIIRTYASSGAHMRRLAVLFALAALAVPASAQEWPRAPEYDVLLTSYDIQPEVIRLRADQPVRLRFVNDSHQRHDFTARGFFRSARLRRRDMDMVERRLDQGRAAFDPDDRSGPARRALPGREPRPQAAPARNAGEDRRRVRIQAPTSVLSRPWLKGMAPRRRRR